MPPREPIGSYVAGIPWIMTIGYLLLGRNYYGRPHHAVMGSPVAQSYHPIPAATAAVGDPGDPAAAIGPGGGVPTVLLGIFGFLLCM